MKNKRIKGLKECLDCWGKEWRDKMKKKECPGGILPVDVSPKINNSIPFIFEVGDIICNLEKDDSRVITEIIDDEEYYKRYYKFMNLNRILIPVLPNGNIEQKKGSYSQQPCYIVEKYFSIYNIK